MDIKMTVNTRYRVKFQLDNQRVPRVFVGTYLGDNYIGDAEFNLRPAAGTAALPHAAILSVERSFAPHSQTERFHGPSD